MAEGHGNKGRRWEQAIVGLLTEHTIEAAATTAGVSYRTLKGWLARPKFQQAYRRARRQLVEAALGRLQQVAADAVASLARNLACGQPATEVRAAVAVLQQAVAGVELADVLDAVEDLERRLATLERPRGTPRAVNGRTYGSPP
jgi:hypothetical protein